MRLLFYCAFLLFLANCSKFAPAHKNEDRQIASDSTPSTPGVPKIGDTLSERYPNDQFDGADPSILFHSGFEDGFAGWSSYGSYSGDLVEVVRDTNLAQSGERVFRGQFRISDLSKRGETGGASMRAQKQLTPPGQEFYVRYYTRLEAGTARAHHGSGYRVYSPGNNIGGSAGYRPGGDQRFSSAIDMNQKGEHFFYTYWHEMRSWACADGTTNSGCAGYNSSVTSSTAYYGNSFVPPVQQPIDPHAWTCIEYFVRMNTPNQYDGALALWINDGIADTFERGNPLGNWLRDTFHTQGTYFNASTAVPFEGFNFRTSPDVRYLNVNFEHYQQYDTIRDRRSDTPAKTDVQTVYFDDIVVATSRIGCQVKK